MAPRLNTPLARRALASTQKNPITLPLRANPLNGLQSWRHNSSGSKDPNPEDADGDNASKGLGPTQDPLPHVGEEKAQMEKIMKGGGIMGKEKRCDGVVEAESPEMEQGTPVSEILQRDEEAQKHMPKVMQEQMRMSKSSGSGPSNPSGTRGFSTSARAAEEMHQQPPARQDGQNAAGAGAGAGGEASDPSAALVANMISDITEKASDIHGLKFPVPESLPPTENFRARYDSVLKSFTNMMMQDGKKARAERNMSTILDYLRTSPPPVPNPRRRLLPDGPPAAQLPLNPVQYLNHVVSSVGPLVTVRNLKGMAGGGRALPVPRALGPNDRRRTAIRWIIDASDKRRDSKFANRVAQEIVAAAEGRSSVWDRREQAHKIGTAARANPAIVELKARFKR